MIDTHCHLDFYKSHDLPGVLEKAREAGVAKFIVPAVAPGNFAKILSLGESNESIYPAYGIHPWLISYTEGDLDKLSAWVLKYPPVAIGECGLDFYKSRENETRQRQVFTAQISLAKDYDLPLIIHSTRAVDEVLKILKAQNMHKGVFHGFNGSVQQAEKILAAGFYLGVGGLITNPKAKKMQELIKFLPIDRILLETDSPDQGVYDSDDKTPANVLIIAKELARIKNIEFSKLVGQCDANANSCFKIK